MRGVHTFHPRLRKLRFEQVLTRGTGGGIGRKESVSKQSKLVYLLTGYWYYKSIIYNVKISYSFS